ncbi:MAG: S8 family serine peptidase [Cyclobacteriaceae bacterium]
MEPYKNFKAPSGDRPQFTGKKLIMLDQEAGHKNIDDEARGASLRLAFSGDYKSHEGDYLKAFSEGDGIVFETFGVAVVNDNHDKEINTLVGAKRAFKYMEPERYVYALHTPGNPGPRSLPLAIWNFICQIFGFKNDRPPIVDKPPQIIYEDDQTAFWGIHAIQSLASSFTGKGVNLAILDTGMYLEHPDYSERDIVSQSFISGEEVDDRNGHGTHCAGIATGGDNKSSGIRYGVAKEAKLFAGKVLSNAGSGSDSGILAGLEWALNHECKIISMSLGASVGPNDKYSRIYNDIAKKALDKGTIIIAAAGNDSRRSQGDIRPVNHPANCPNIMAVGAVDNRSRIANFSCGGINVDGGAVDIAAPGVDIYSTWKMPQQYAIISGTSMSTPFVAGVAAKLWEANPNASAKAIWEQLTNTALKLDLPEMDAGAGLVQAPK